VIRTPGLIRRPTSCFGVVGGVFVCASWALRIGTHAVGMVVGPSDEGSIAPQTTARASGLRTKWGGENLRSRPNPLGKVVRQGNSWVVEGGSPYTSYAGTPASPYPASPYSPAPPATTAPIPPPPMSARSVSGQSARSVQGLGLAPGSYGPPPASPSPNTSYAPLPGGSPHRAGSPYSAFPSSPAPGVSMLPGSPVPPPPKKDKDD
jgi:hypothetical protein